MENDKGGLFSLLFLCNKLRFFRDFGNNLIMKRFSMGLLLSCIFFSINAQSKRDSSNVLLKIYNTSTFRQSIDWGNPKPDILDKVNSHSLLKPTIGINWASKKSLKKFHELEFYWNSRTDREPGFVLNNIDTAAIITHKRKTLDLAVRYEYNFASARINSFSKFLLSGGTLLWFKSFHNSASSHFKSTRDYFLSNTLFLIPRLEFRLTDRMLLDINVPLEFSELYLIRSYSDNPLIPERLRRVNSVEWQMSRPRAYIRVGIGFRI